LARACNRIKALFVTFSIDYVFDGDKKALYQEDDKPNPLQIYGITRVAGKYAALAGCAGAILEGKIRDDQQAVR